MVHPSQSRLQLPPEELPLNSFFESIIEKKVNKQALNILETLVDVLCSYIYSPYNNRLNYKIGQLDVDEELDPVDPAKPMATSAQKVHYFMDGAPLYDRTATQRAQVVAAKYFNISEDKEVLGEDEIVIDGKPVVFDTRPNVKLLFGKNYGTDHVIVSDVKEFPELVFIFEREITNQYKAWVVNTTVPHKKQTMGGQLVIGEKEILIAEEINPSSVPQIIVQRMG
jgi:hypothetical protein